MTLDDILQALRTDPDLARAVEVAIASSRPIYDRLTHQSVTEGDSMITKTVTLSTPYEQPALPEGSKTAIPGATVLLSTAAGVHVVYVARCGWCGLLEHVTTFKQYRVNADLPKYTPLPPDWRWQDGLPMCPKHEAIVIEKETP